MPADAEPQFHVLSSRSTDLRVRDYKRLRAHRKARSGCLPCKAKKVKCDECRPICARCQRNKRPCVYESLPSTEHGQGSSTAHAIPRLRNKVGPLGPDPKHGTSYAQLLNHFYANWDAIFRIPGREEVASLSHSNSLVHNTVLAIAACHLRHMSPGILEHRIAEHFYQSLVIRDFQAAIETPRALLGQSRANAVLLAAVLLNMIAFTLPHQENAIQIDPRSSWVFSSREDRLGWLALQTGLRPLVLSLPGYLARTRGFLDPIIFGHRIAGWSNARKPQSLDIIPESWVRTFKLKNHSASCDSNAGADPNDIFRPAAMALAYLRDINPSQSTVFLNLMFLMKVHGDFRLLLYNKDRKAVWLFGYWLGLMCRYTGIWWCERRVRRDYQAICIWLDEQQLDKDAEFDDPDWDGMMQELKQAPVYTSREH